MKILVVDDARVVRAVLGRGLSLSGHEVLTAENGLEGVLVFKQHHETLDAVILDVWMPVMDGEAALSEMRAIDSSVPIIVLACDIDLEIRQRLEPRSDAWLSKPAKICTIEGVLSRLRRT